MPLDLGPRLHILCSAAEVADLVEGRARALPYIERAAAKACIQPATNAAFRRRLRGQLSVPSWELERCA